MKSMWASKKSRGFTIIELVTVLVVIVILVGITAVAYARIQNEARASTVRAGLIDIHNAFTGLWKKTGQPRWWNETVFLGTNNPRIGDIIQSSPIPLRDYIATEPKSASIPGLTWNYRNIGTTRSTTACATLGSEASDSKGVLIVVGGLSEGVIQAVDRQMDDGNPLCGKVRYGDAEHHTLYYQMSFSETFL